MKPVRIRTLGYAAGIIFTGVAIIKWVTIPVGIEALNIIVIVTTLVVATAVLFLDGYRSTK